VSLLYCVSSVFCFRICFILLLRGPVFLTTQRLQPIQDEYCLLFEEIEGRSVELEQVVTTVEHCLEGPVNEAFIQEFVEKEALAQQ
jgi:hypothetical protein